MMFHGKMNFIWALLVSVLIIGFVWLIAAASILIFQIVSESFHLFPYHTVGAAIIFCVWFAVKIKHHAEDDS